MERDRSGGGGRGPCGGDPTPCDPVDEAGQGGAHGTGESMPLAGDYRAVFSPVVGVPGWIADHWRVELFDASDGGRLSRPVAVAYTSEYSLLGPVLDYFIVFDQHRKQGHAMRLMRAIHARWPGIHHTERLRD